MPAFRVSRSIVIQRTPEKVFDTVANFKTWTSWSPWLGIDPNAKVAIQSDGASLGSRYQWEGDVVGAGEIEHVRFRRPAEIEDELRFSKPFKSNSKVCFRFDGVRDGTKVTWEMDGSLPWFMFWMRASMETLIGMDYQRGLKMLKDLIENGKVLSRVEVVGVELVPARTVLGIRDSCSMQDIGPAVEQAFAKAKSALAAARVRSDGAMISAYHSVDLKQGRFDFTAGFAVSDPKDVKDHIVAQCRLPATRALHLRHVGSYHHLGNAWSGGYQFARHKKLKLAKGDSFEVYRSDPSTTPESEWITDLYFPIR